MQLVIVESPTKARKLSEYLGNDFSVRASVGHVRDLPKKELGIDLKNNFEPAYVVSEDKTKVIRELKKIAQQADRIILATDPDREGEAIAWHVQYLLATDAKKKNPPQFLRATFHEITKAAVLEAIKNPSELRMDLVDAQQARRVVDRLVGYQISPVLWRKIRRGLSAGRVQSVALRLIVEREREIEQFNPEEYWEVDVALNADLKNSSLSSIFVEGRTPDSLPENVFVARVLEINNGKYEPKKEADVTDVVDALKTATYTVKSVDRTERKRSSLPPFTTSTLQQGAANRLGFTSKQTMMLAQQLYEEGLITYHRTDSVFLSLPAVDVAREYIGKIYGKPYVPEKPRLFKNASKNAQEAHEAIRVTDVTVSSNSIIGQGRLTEKHARLYDLIWRRFLASQMETAVYDSTTVLVRFQGKKDGVLKANGSVLKFDGWMKLFPASEDMLLPAVTVDQPLGFVDLNAQQKFTQPPPRYNDASLVKELEKRGIGRPSTYASIISVLEERTYVTRDQKRFVATSVGMTVSDFLMKHFTQIMDYDFTADMEENLDRVARGEKEWKKVVGDFYWPLEKIIEKVKESADRESIPVEKTGEACPTCGETEKGEVVIRTGRFGKFKSCSRFPDCKYTENIVEKVPDMKCPLCSEGEVIIKNSRWGKSFFGCSTYPKCDWASWQKPEPNLKISKTEWATMQAERKEKAKNRKTTRPTSSKTKKTKSASRKK